MKTKSLLILVGLLVLAWVFLFQGAQTASSSPLLRITLTPSVAPTATTVVVTLPPPPEATNPPLIPVSGSDKSSDGSWLIIGGVALLAVGVVSLALPRKRQS